jgi:hypothetical protein
LEGLSLLMTLQTSAWEMRARDKNSDVCERGRRSAVQRSAVVIINRMKVVCKSIGNFTGLD